MLSGCEGYQPSGQPPLSQLNATVQSQSHRLSFFEDQATGAILALNGQKLSDVLHVLAQDPPGFVRVKPHGNRLTEEEITRLLQQSGLYGYSAVEVMPAAAAPQDDNAVLELELTYYSYTFADCGTQLHRRLLDHEAWVTPGFGCSVNQNRLVSLVRPASPATAGKLAPPLARSEAKAITTYQALPPRPFPPANN
jgi:type IV pilus biogenesis protein CpaD/CtpE